MLHAWSPILLQKGLNLAAPGRPERGFVNWEQHVLGIIGQHKRVQAGLYGAYIGGREFGKLVKTCERKGEGVSSRFVLWWGGTYREREGGS